MLEYARANNPGAEIKRADVEAIPFPDSCFDFVLCIEVLRYLPDSRHCIEEIARVLKPGAPLLMVNDNVRYAGASISVDLILSAIAESLGFHVEKILVLPNGKGNSSQQMGQHGREPARKCVYVWRKA